MDIEKALVDSCFMAKAESGFRKLGHPSKSKADSGQETTEMNNRELNDSIVLLEEILREIPLKSATEAAAVGRTIGVLKRTLRQRLTTNVEKKQ